MIFIEVSLTNNFFSDNKPCDKVKYIGQDNNGKWSLMKVKDDNSLEVEKDDCSGSGMTVNSKYVFKY
jgi:hypothetical protein